MRKRMQKGTLTPAAIIEAALQLADRKGLEAVTIRALAAKLRASPMSLYGHFADKHALLEGMRTEFFAQALAGVKGSSWQECLRQIALGYLEAVRARPHLLPLLAHSSPPPPSVFPVMDKLMDLMLEDGFSFVQALQSWLAASSFGTGLAITERTRPEAQESDASALSQRWSMMTSLLPRLPRVRRVTSIAEVAGQLEDFGWDDLFEQGCQIFIAGMEASLTSVKRKRKSS